MNPIKSLNVTLSQPEAHYEWSIQSQTISSDTIYMIGYEFDGTACFRKGTFFGPNALRAVSDGIESYSPYLDADLEDVTFCDLGNLQLEHINYDTDYSEEELHQIAETQWHKGLNDFEALFNDVDLAANNVKIMTLGGEHSISYAPIKKYLQQYPELTLVHLDAHADLRDGYLGHHYSHASIIRRVTDLFGPGHKLIQYGIRSGTAEEYQWMKQHDSLKTNRQQFLESIKAIPDTHPIYLTFDLDYFDPSYFPGTGTPEPGGEDFHSFVSLCKILKQKNFVGCDVVELSPPIDSTGNSDVFAAKVVRELLLCMKSEENL